ncbi:hypothetical protein BEN78_04475 [Xanthomonas citri pv. mangiferaeindicae]|nr:hypothetical protein BEN78_04475 [Xanthomonas citri pv. mangiferaeindicae]
MSHPEISADAIGSNFAFPVRYARSAGEARVTRAGKSLGGTYATTEVSFDISGGVASAEEAPLVELLQRSLAQLPLGQVKELVRTKGECFFLVGIYSESNMLVYFTAEVLAALGAVSVGLKLDFYGGEEA